MDGFRRIHNSYDDDRISLEDFSQEEQERLTKQNVFGTLRVTDAIRPHPEAELMEGYRFDFFEDRAENIRMPVIIAAASREKLFDLFMDMATELSDGTVDVVLETSHYPEEGNRHLDMYEQDVDSVVLLSKLCDYEDLLLNDGCTGISVLNPGSSQELQFEEHKMLILYNEPLQPFEDILRWHGLARRQDMRFISEYEHFHLSHERYWDEFNRLRRNICGGD